MESKAAARLAAEYPTQAVLLESYYGQNVVAITDGGVIDFNPDGVRDIVGAERFSYNKYLRVQIQSIGKQRQWLAACYYNISMGFKGRIEAISDGYILFNHIFVEGMYPDWEMFNGREDHVWMHLSEFQTKKEEEKGDDRSAPLNVGDNLEFNAEVYRYVRYPKTAAGRQAEIDYGLRNPSEIRKIAEYELPTDKELARQGIGQLVCETCVLDEQCDRMHCLRLPV